MLQELVYPCYVDGSSTVIASITVGDPRNEISGIQTNPRYNRVTPNKCLLLKDLAKLTVDKFQGIDRCLLFFRFAHFDFRFEITPPPKPNCPPYSFFVVIPVFG